VIALVLLAIDAPTALNQAEMVPPGTAPVPVGVWMGASAVLALPLAGRRIAPRTAAGVGLAGVVLTVLTHGPVAVCHFALVGTAVLS
jgi:hypothetical protein